MQLKFTEKIKFNQYNDLIMVYKGQITQGIDFFAYIKCDEKGVNLMREDYHTKTARHMDEYGEVIYQDNIKEPDEKAKQFLEDYIAENGGELM